MRNVFGKIILFGLTAAVCLFPSAQLAAAETDYYAPVTSSGGDALLGRLHDLITTTHKRYSTYADCRDYAPMTDPGTDGKGVVEFYTHETIQNYIGSSNKRGTWNREHVWCKNLSNGLWPDINNNEAGGGADLHHIRPAEMSLNSTRSNRKFGKTATGAEAYSRNEDGQISRLGGWYSGDVFEPLDETKGDVARIVMYVYTHYNTYENVGGSTNGNGAEYYFGTLHFTHVISASSEKEAIAMLLEWNRLDPVDKIETTRNEAVFQIQGNRNPFIDHPEYAEAIWGGGEFHSAVAGIVTEGSLAERLASLNRALAAYGTLSDAEKALAEEDIGRLRAAIEDYNRAVGLYNGEAGRAEEGAYFGAAGLLGLAEGGI